MRYFFHRLWKGMQMMIGALLLWLPTLAFADGPESVPLTRAIPRFSLTQEGLADFFAWIINALLGLTGVIAFLMILWGGFLWLTSAGSEERVTKGRKTLMWAAIGLVLAFLSFILFNEFLNVFTQEAPVTGKSAETSAAGATSATRDKACCIFDLGGSNGKKCFSVDLTSAEHDCGQKGRRVLAPEYFNPGVTVNKVSNSDCTNQSEC
ncbi:hypothetical protein HY629_02525 [Candidatus Uhrbacteria bacterium]|nr:hypothetical protein [Candidatus Uhrbacteria bacterium]